MFEGTSWEHRDLGEMCPTSVYTVAGFPRDKAREEGHGGGQHSVLAGRVEQACPIYAQQPT